MRSCSCRRKVRRLDAERNAIQAISHHYLKRVGIDCEQIGIEREMVSCAQGQTVSPIVTSLGRLATQMSCMEQQRMSNRANRTFCTVLFKYVETEHLLSRTNAHRCPL